MPTRYQPRLSELATAAVDELTARHQARETALVISRQVIRNSANAIRAVHRNEFAEAGRLIAEAAARLRESDAIRGENPEIYYAGFLSDARKEFSEANITLAVIAGEDIPDAAALGIDPPAYLKRQARAVAQVPLVAIGGITAGNAAAVVEAGADAVCVTAAVGRAAEPEAAAAALVEAIRAAGGRA